MKSHFIKDLFFKTTIVCILILASCSAESNTPKVENETIIPPDNFPYTFGKMPTDGKKIYIPEELKGNDFNLNTSVLSYQRSASTDDIILFWEKGFGQYPGKTANTKMQVDIAHILIKAEEYFKYYRDTMKFVIAGSSQSDKYRMIVILKYQDEWLATGSGYDNVIGALWVNPEVLKFDHIIAHEFGHSFQYQVFCDGGYGFRDQNYVGSFWEQCAQYMSWQENPDAFTRDIPFFLENAHKNFSHEDFRYESIYLMEYWKEKHGIAFLGELWRKAIAPEHPIQAYKRITNIDQSTLNDEIFEYACKNLTWDYPLGAHNRDFIQSLSDTEQKKFKHKTKLLKIENDYYQIAAEQMPQSYGYNAIQLKVPPQGTVVKIDFKGLDNQWSSIAGWRWGVVEIKNDSTPIYGEISKDKEGVKTFTSHSDVKELWLIVTGAPTEHVNHVWDDNSANDENFPYKVKFENTSPL